MRNFAASLAACMTVGLVGSVATTAPAQADTRIQKTFDQWTVECTETDKKICGLYYKLVNAKNKRVMLGLVHRTGAERRGKCRNCPHAHRHVPG